MDLVEGRHEYKFFVDGQWLIDPHEVSIPEVSVESAIVTSTAA